MKPLADLPTLCGPLRKPRQMLADRVYDSHKSIHNDDTAATLGLRTGPIEGPTHLSQFDPLLHDVFGQAWFETGCIRRTPRTWWSRARKSAPSRSCLPPTPAPPASGRGICDARRCM